jgi:hypothetical protein
MDEEIFAFGSFRLVPGQRMLSEDGKPVRLAAVHSRHQSHR